MKIVYTDYAEDTIKDRALNKKIIEGAVLNPDEVVEGKRGRKVAHKIIKDKLLRVVYEIEEKSYIVVTVYYTAPKRYMKNEDKF